MLLMRVACYVSWYSAFAAMLGATSVPQQSSAQALFLIWLYVGPVIS